MSSTDYLDMMVLDEKGEIVKDIMDSIKGYCGFFAFISSICNNSSLDDLQKTKLIANVIESSLMYMEKKYKANLDLYNTFISDNLMEGNKFEQLALTPVKMREDYEAGLIEARKYLYIEAKDILKILNIDLNI